MPESAPLASSLGLASDPGLILAGREVVISLLWDDSSLGLILNCELSNRFKLDPQLIPGRPMRFKPDLDLAPDSGLHLVLSFYTSLNLDSRHQFPASTSSIDSPLRFSVSDSVLKVPMPCMHFITIEHYSTAHDRRQRFIALKRFITDSTQDTEGAASSRTNPGLFRAHSAFALTRAPATN